MWKIGHGIKSNAGFARNRRKDILTARSKIYPVEYGFAVDRRSIQPGELKTQRTLERAHLPFRFQACPMKPGPPPGSFIGVSALSLPDESPSLQ